MHIPSFFYPSPPYGQGGVGSRKRPCRRSGDPLFLPFPRPDSERLYPAGGAERAPDRLSLHLLLKGGPIGLQLRASNEGLLRPRVARAKETNGLPSPPTPGG